ncbi:hypothetical protein BpHYR1_022428 [Brachionus plicatilis]|uniref:Nuclear pore complex protein Nup85 n=1 Tax=Brachionus plicatilis TaxID=10195 RepID=A0A3M7REB5_BRAPC|nr:hypothetical protein BpHYR1_022428 [Brachionus plicatilis]
MTPEVFNDLHQNLEANSQSDTIKTETVNLSDQLIIQNLINAGTLLSDLQEWYRTTNNIDPMIQNIFSSNSENPENIYQDEKYWICVLMAVVQGRIETTRHLLSFYPIEKAPVLKSIK